MKLKLVLYVDPMVAGSPQPGREFLRCLQARSGFFRMVQSVDALDFRSRPAGLAVHLCEQLRRDRRLLNARQILAGCVVTYGCSQSIDRLRKFSVPGIVEELCQPNV